MGLDLPVPSGLTDVLFRRIAEEAPVAVAMAVAPEWRVVYANRAWLRAVGGTMPVIGAPVARLFPGGPAAGDIDRIEDARRAGRTVSGHGLARRAGGEVTWWDDDIHPLPDPDGSIPAVLIMAREVTAHVQARREADAARARLAEDAERMRLAIGAAGMYFWDYDLRTGRVDWSDGLEAACGLPPGGFGGTAEAFVALLHPGDRERVTGELERSLAGQAPYDTEFRMLRGDGGERRVVSRGTVLRDAAGRPVRMIGIDLDVTQARADQLALQANEERLRLAQDAAGLGLWEYHPLTGAAVLSAGYRGIHGLTEAQAAGLDHDGWLALVHPDDRRRMNDLTLAMTETGELDAEFRAIRADTGAVVWIHSRARAFQRDTGPVLLGIIQDVTARRQAHDALATAVEARGLLIREADHRIKNSLQLAASLLRMQERRSVEPETRRALRAAFARVMAIGDLHRTLYQSADLRTVDLARVLADLARHAAALAPRVHLDCDLPDSLPLDAERAIPLGLLVNELATNAVRHAYGEAGGTVAISAQAAAGPGADMILVTVADTGCGLPAVPLPRGDGLGSILVQALGRQIGAEVTIRSAPGQGTSVRIRLPRDPARA